MPNESGRYLNPAAYYALLDIGIYLHAHNNHPYSIIGRKRLPKGKAKMAYTYPYTI